MHLVIIFVINQPDAQFFFMYVYFYSLHVSGSCVSIIRRINCINTTSGVCHSIHQSRTHSPLRQTAHTDACNTYHTAYKTFSLRVNPRGSKHVGENRN